MASIQPRTSPKKFESSSSRKFELKLWNFKVLICSPANRHDDVVLYRLVCHDAVWHDLGTHVAGVLTSTGAKLPSLTAPERRRYAVKESAAGSLHRHSELRRDRPGRRAAWRRRPASLNLSWRVRCQTLLWFFSQIKKLYRARSLLYRRQILQENIRWKTFDEMTSRSTRFTYSCTAQTSNFSKCVQLFLPFQEWVLQRSLFSNICQS